MNKEDVKLVVQETLSSFGFTIVDLNQVQQDMAYIRNLRLGAQAFKTTIIKSFIGITVPAFIYLIWDSFKGVVK